MRILRIFVASAFFLAPDLALAQGYFSASTISPTLIDKPLDRASPEYAKEVRQIIKMQSSYDRAELERAISEIKITPDIVSRNVDPSLSREAFPKLFKLLERSTKTSVEVARNFKHYWNVKRPYLLEVAVKPLIEKSESPAYPSGHTVVSFVLAKILGQLIPQKAQDFIAEADKIAQRRVLIGMHYPQDLEGGRQAGLLVFDALMKNQEFLFDFNSAKEEVRNQYSKW